MINIHIKKVIEAGIYLFNLFYYFLDGLKINVFQKNICIVEKQN